MSTLLAAAEARAAQATHDREVAELQLIAILPDLRCPAPVRVADIIHWRAVEAVIEASPDGEFACAYSHYRRAQTIERKARAAAHKARWAATRTKAHSNPVARVREMADALVSMRRAA